jgi:hypothetical protein
VSGATVAYQPTIANAALANAATRRLFIYARRRSDSSATRLTGLPFAGNLQPALVMRNVEGGRK